MDKIDKDILGQLQENAKQNTKEIANKVGLSTTPTYERIKKLEQLGIIKGYVALLDREKIRKDVVAYCQVTLSKHQKKLIDNFKSKILCFPEIMECLHVSGNFDFLLKVVTDDINSFHLFINGKLSVVEEIVTIHSSFVMDTVKETNVYVL